MKNRARYSISFVAAVAMSGDSRLTIDRAAAQIGCSVSYLEQFASQLMRSGIFHSMKGPGGGYVLDRPANAITVDEILEAVGELPRVIANPSALDSAWNAVAVETRFTLGGMTVADLICPERRKAA